PHRYQGGHRIILTGHDYSTVSDRLDAQFVARVNARGLCRCTWDRPLVPGRQAREPTPPLSYFSGHEVGLSQDRKGQLPAQGRLAAARQVALPADGPLARLTAHSPPPPASPGRVSA